MTENPKCKQIKFKKPEGMTYDQVKRIDPSYETNGYHDIIFYTFIQDKYVYVSKILCLIKHSVKPLDCDSHGFGPRSCYKDRIAKREKLRKENFDAVERVLDLSSDELDSSYAERINPLVAKLYIQINALLFKD